MILWLWYKPLKDTLLLEVFIYYTVTCIFLLGIVPAVSVDSVKASEGYAEDKWKVPMKITLLTREDIKAVENLPFLGQTVSCGKQFSQNTNRSITALLSHWL